MSIVITATIEKVPLLDDASTSSIAHASSHPLGSDRLVWGFEIENSSDGQAVITNVLPDTDASLALREDDIITSVNGIDCRRLPADTVVQIVDSCGSPMNISVARPRPPSHAASMLSANVSHVSHAVHPTSFHTDEARHQHSFRNTSSPLTLETAALHQQQVLQQSQQAQQPESNSAQDSSHLAAAEKPSEPAASEPASQQPAPSVEDLSEKVLERLIEVMAQLVPRAAEAVQSRPAVPDPLLEDAVADAVHSQQQQQQQQTHDSLPLGQQQQAKDAVIEVTSGSPHTPSENVGVLGSGTSAATWHHEPASSVAADVSERHVHKQVQMLRSNPASSSSSLHSTDREKAPTNDRQPSQRVVMDMGGDTSEIETDASDRVSSEESILELQSHKSSEQRQPSPLVGRAKSAHVLHPSAFRPTDAQTTDGVSDSAEQAPLKKTSTDFSASDDEARNVIQQSNLIKARNTPPRLSINIASSTEADDSEYSPQGSISSAKPPNSPHRDRNAPKSAGSNKSQDRRSVLVSPDHSPVKTPTTADVDPFSHNVRALRVLGTESKQDATSGTSTDISDSAFDAAGSDQAINQPMSKSSSESEVTTENKPAFSGRRFASETDTGRRRSSKFRSFVGERKPPPSKDGRHELSMVKEVSGSSADKDLQADAVAPLTKPPPSKASDPMQRRTNSMPSRPAFTDEFETSGDVFTLSMQRELDGGLGFSILGGVDTTYGGTFVSAVQLGTRAQQAGLRRGDRLLAVNEFGLLGTTCTEATARLENAPQSFDLLVMRLGEEQYQLLLKAAKRLGTFRKVTLDEPFFRPLVWRRSGRDSKTYEETGTIKRFVLDKAQHNNKLGLRIAGGTDTDLGGVFISHIGAVGAARACKGLREGSRILEVNGISMLRTKESDNRKALSGRGPLVLVVQENSDWQVIESKTETMRRPDIMPLHGHATSGKVKTVEVHPHHGELGFDLAGSVEDALGGVFVTSVSRSLHARHNWLETGDRVLAINGHGLLATTAQEVFQVLQEAAGGGLVTLIIQRLGHEQWKKVFQEANKARQQERKRGILHRRRHRIRGLKLRRSKHANSLETAGDIHAVELHRNADEPCGLVLKGGTQTRLGAIFITGIESNGVAAREGLLKAGDRVLEIDGRCMINASVEEAISSIKSAGSDVDFVVQRLGQGQWDALKESMKLQNRQPTLLRAPAQPLPNGNAAITTGEETLSPSRNSSLRLRPSRSLQSRESNGETEWIRKVQLDVESRHGTSGLGFTIVGPDDECCQVERGRDNQDDAISTLTQGSALDGKRTLQSHLSKSFRRNGIRVSQLRTGGAADVDGRLRTLDRILFVNGVDFSNMTFTEAAQTFAGFEEEVRMVVQRGRERLAIKLQRKFDDTGTAAEQQPQPQPGDANSANLHKVPSGTNMPSTWGDASRPRELTLTRVDGSFGFSIIGRTHIGDIIESPRCGGVFVESIDERRAGSGNVPRIGDMILKLNKIDIHMWTVNHVTAALKRSKAQVTIEVVHDQKSYLEMIKVFNDEKELAAEYEPSANHPITRTVAKSGIIKCDPEWLPDRRSSASRARVASLTSPSTAMDSDASETFASSSTRNASRASAFAASPATASGVSSRGAGTPARGSVSHDPSERTVPVIAHPKEEDVGFSLMPGSDGHGAVVSAIRPGSMVDQANLLQIGDRLLEIDGIDVRNMNLDQVLSVVKAIEKASFLIKVAFDADSLNTLSEQKKKGSRRYSVVRTSATIPASDVSITEPSSKASSKPGSAFTPPSDRDGFRMYVGSDDEGDGEDHGEERRHSTAKGSASKAQSLRSGQRAERKSQAESNTSHSFKALLSHATEGRDSIRAVSPKPKGRAPSLAEQEKKRQLRSASPPLHVPLPPRTRSQSIDQNTAHPSQAEGASRGRSQSIAAPDMLATDLELKPDGGERLAHLVRQPGEKLGLHLFGEKEIPSAIFIDRIAPNSTACLNEGLRVGDRILSINGIDTSQIRLGEANEMLRSATDIHMLVRHEPVVLERYRSSGGALKPREAGLIPVEGPESSDMDKALQDRLEHWAASTKEQHPYQVVTKRFSRKANKELPIKFIGTVSEDVHVAKCTCLPGHLSPWCVFGAVNGHRTSDLSSPQLRDLLSKEASLDIELHCYTQLPEWLSKFVSKYERADVTSVGSGGGQQSLALPQRPDRPGFDDTSVPIIHDAMGSPDKTSTTPSRPPLSARQSSDTLGYSLDDMDLDGDPTTTGPAIQGFSELYPGTKQIRRQLPSELRWNQPCRYCPASYTAPAVIANASADMDMSKDQDFQFNAMDGPIDRHSYSGRYQLDADGFPLNPKGRTGLKGRGLLLRWGPNHAVHIFVSRFVRDEDGNIVTSGGREKMQVLACSSSPYESWTVPSIFVRTGKIDPLKAARRALVYCLVDRRRRAHPQRQTSPAGEQETELRRNAYSSFSLHGDSERHMYSVNSAVASPVQSSANLQQQEEEHLKLSELVHGDEYKVTAMAAIDELLNDPLDRVEMFRGVVNDARNTDNAWVETIAINIHDVNDSLSKLQIPTADILASGSNSMFKPVSGQDLAWVPLQAGLNVRMELRDLFVRLAHTHHAYFTPKKTRRGKSKHVEMVLPRPDKGTSYGFKFITKLPSRRHIVEHIKSGSPAQGLLEVYDELEELNGKLVVGLNHEQVVALIKDSKQLILKVLRRRSSSSQLEPMKDNDVAVEKVDHLSRDGRDTTDLQQTLTAFIRRPGFDRPFDFDFVTTEDRHGKTVHIFSTLDKQGTTARYFAVGDTIEKVAGEAVSTLTHEQLNNWLYDHVKCEIVANRHFQPDGSFPSQEIIGLLAHVKGKSQRIRKASTIKRATLPDARAPAKISLVRTDRSQSFGFGFGTCANGVHVVHRIKADSKTPASAQLCLGDHIVEANGVSLPELTHEALCEELRSSLRVDMVVLRHSIHRRHKSSLRLSLLEKDQGTYEATLEDLASTRSSTAENEHYCFVDLENNAGVDGEFDGDLIRHPVKLIKSISQDQLGNSELEYVISRHKRKLPFTLVASDIRQSRRGSVFLFPVVETASADMRKHGISPGYRLVRIKPAKDDRWTTTENMSPEEAINYIAQSKGRIHLVFSQDNTLGEPFEQTLSPVPSSPPHDPEQNAPSSQRQHSQTPSEHGKRAAGSQSSAQDSGSNGNDGLPLRSFPANESSRSAPSNQHLSSDSTVTASQQHGSTSGTLESTPAASSSHSQMESVL